MAVLAAMVLDAWTKGAGNLTEMLWACHWASAAIALGLLAGSRATVAAGLLFHLSLGIPAWLLGVLFTGEVHPTSVLVHSLPPLTAALYLRGLEALPPYTWLRAWVMHPAAIAVSERFARPELNVNMAHEPWPPLAHLFPNLHLFHLAAISLSLLLLLLMNRAMERWLAERKVSRQMAASRLDSPRIPPARAADRRDGSRDRKRPVARVP
jgi:hypothetical protein